jgi:hypothetical protein
VGGGVVGADYHQRLITHVCAYPRVAGGREIAGRAGARIAMLLLLLLSARLRTGPAWVACHGVLIAGESLVKGGVKVPDRALVPPELDEVVGAGM